MKSSLFVYIKRLDVEQRLFWTTLIFYILVLVLNPSNKLLALSFIALFAAYTAITKKIFDSLFFTYLASLIVQTGKTYPIQLIPQGIFPVEIYPDGYFTSITVSAFHFISFAMLLLCIRRLIVERKKFQLVFTDLLVVILYILKILSAITSNNVNLSLPFELLSLSTFISYFYARFYIQFNKRLWKELIHILAALVIFQSLLGALQFASKSPLYKNIETQINIEYYGNAVDETQFTFRPVGTFDHANSLGIWVSSVCILLALYALKNKSILIWLSVFSGFVLVASTLSRSAWLGMAGGFVFIFYLAYKENRHILNTIWLKTLKYRFVIFPILLAVTLAFFIPRIQNSIYSFQTNSGGLYFRKIQIDDAIEVIKLHPILGIGTAMSVYEGISLNMSTFAASVPLQIHNWYLNMGTENGLVALFIIMLFITISIKKILTADKISLTCLSIVGAIVSAGIAAVFQPYINYQLVLLLLSLINGVIIEPRKQW